MGGGSKRQTDYDPMKEEVQEQGVGVASVGASTVKFGTDITNTANKLNEMELTSTGLENYAFNQNIDGQIVPTKLFERTPLEGKNIVGKYLKGSFTDPHKRLKLNKEALQNFSYKFEGNDLTGESGVRQMMTDKGISSENIDKYFPSNAEDKLQGTDTLAGKLSSKVSKVKENFTQFTDDRSWRLMPPHEKIKIYKDGQVINKMSEVTDKIASIPDGDVASKLITEGGAELASDIASDVAETAGEEILKKGGEEVLKKGGEELAEEGLKKLGEEGAKKIGEEAGKLGLQGVGKLAADLGGKALSAVGMAKGALQAGSGVKGILEGDVNYKNVSDVAHGAVAAATPALLAAGPAGWAVIGVNTVWDLLDG